MKCQKMIIPETINATEYVPFNLAYEITNDDPLITPTIQSVSIAASDGVDYSSEIEVIISSPTTFSLSGVLSDVFARQLSFLDKDDLPRITSKFSNIPSDFSTLYSYLGPTVESIDITVTAITDLGVEATTIVVYNNWAISNAKLSEYVAKGKY